MVRNARDNIYAVGCGRIDRGEEIQDIYHGVVMYMKFYQDVNSYRGVNIAIWLPKFWWIVLSSAITSWNLYWVYMSKYSVLMHVLGYLATHYVTVKTLVRL